MRRLSPRSTLTDTLFPYTPLFRSSYGIYRIGKSGADVDLPIEMARAVARLPAIDFDRFVHNGRFGRIARFQRSKVDEQLESRAGLANGLSRSIIVGADIIESAHHCRSEENPSELQYLMRNTYAVYCWKKKTTTTTHI